MKNLFNAGFGYGRVFPLKTKKLINTVKNYFRFVAVEDSSILLSSFNMETRGPDNTLDLLYSKDGKLWTQYDFNAIPLNAGETLYMKGNNPNGLNSTNRVCSFGNLEFVGFSNGNCTTGKFECHGNIMSLLYGDDFENKTTIPNSQCFAALFIACDGLLTAPKLSATTLTESCYQDMFSGCTSLVTAPELPATTLETFCYESMFGGCSKLNNITMLATDISASGCLIRWVDGVSPTGTFTKHKNMTSLPAETIPEGWTVVDYAA